MLIKEKKSVLVACADPQENVKIRELLAPAGYETAAAFSGKEALARCGRAGFSDMILLCDGLGDGPALVRALRKISPAPIIVLSRDERAAVAALDAGAHDYFVLPFGTAEHFARLRAAFRNAARSGGVFSQGGLCIDYAARAVSANGRDVHLTPIEFRILSLLARNAGKVLTHEQIINEIWGPYNSDNLVLRVNMANIRRKVEQDPGKPRLILTVTGVGYRMGG